MSQEKLIVQTGDYRTANRKKAVVTGLRCDTDTYGQLLAVGYIVGEAGPMEWHGSDGSVTDDSPGTNQSRIVGGWIEPVTVAEVQTLLNALYNSKALGGCNLDDQATVDLHNAVTDMSNRLDALRYVVGN